MVEIKSSHEQLRRQVEALSWVHSIDLGNGIVTPGQWGRPNPLIVQAMNDTDFRGARVLDIGCWDGLWSFEAEKRGAKEVYATDQVSQRWGADLPTFALAREALRSQARYYPHLSVYDVRSLGVTDFDVVLFAGVYYHLKDPLLALARLRQVIRTGGTMLIEGAVLSNRTESYARFYYRQWVKDDPSNWWIPTIACLQEWVAASFFEVVKEYAWKPAPRSPIARWFRRPSEDITRYVLLAKAVSRKDPNYSRPDDELKAFDLNEYN